MNDQPLARRRLLAGAGAAAGGAVVAGLAAPSAVHAGGSDHHRSRIEGSWLAKRFDPSDGVERTFVITFARGGAAVTVDVHPVFLNGAGTWKAHGRRVRMTAWYGAAAIPDVQPDLTFEVVADAEVHGNEFAGTFTYTVFLEGTENAVGTGGGTWSGKRITA